MKGAKVSWRWWETETETETETCWAGPLCTMASEQSYLSEQFRKLLKPGRKYTFGRKEPADLVLADKTVSREAGALIMSIPPPTFESVCTTDFSDVEQHRPTVSLQADKKILRIVPPSDEEEWLRNPSVYVGITVDPGTTRALQAGDTIVLSKNAPAVK